jgi:DNA-directed RNA polymerase specialized sigma24 family protein
VVVGAELRAAVGDAMTRLPESHRTVLELLREQNLTLAEAADRMGRTPGAVKKLYGRALCRMETLLGISVGDRRERRRPTR